TRITHRIKDFRRGPRWILCDDFFDALLLLDRNRFAQGQTKLLFTIIALSFLNVLFVELLDGNRGIHPLERAGVVGEEGEDVQRYQYYCSDATVFNPRRVFHQAL